MARYANLPRFGSDATALLLTTVLAAALLAALRAVHTELPRFSRDREVQLSLEAPPAAAPAPPATPEPQPPKRRTSILRHEQASEPQPVATDPAPADVTPIATIARSDPPAPAAASRPDLDAQYAAQLRADIDRRTGPPDTPQYRLRHPSGEVRVRFVVLRSGVAEGVAVERSSGSSILDEAALTIVSSGHYLAMPTNVFVGESRHVFVVTIEFRASR